MTHPHLKSLDVEIVSSGDDILPPSGHVQLSLLDVSHEDAGAVSLAELRLRCAGRMPINLQLSYDLRLVDPSRSYALAVRIEQQGQLLYINTSQHSIKLDKPLGKVQVMVEKVGAVSEGIQGGNLDPSVTNGIHGGNLDASVTNGIHGGNLTPGNGK
ncbi:hypothetical protein D3C71_1365850 [compost metagenome]